MPFELDPPGLQHWPTPMVRFGLTPFGDNLYRIVLAKSRRHMVGGCWPDGSFKYDWVPRYRQVKAAWILERWSMPQCTKRQWEQYVEPISGWPIRGPFPARGDYEFCWEFDEGVPADNLDAIIGAVERGRDRSYDDVRSFWKAEYEAEEKEQKRLSGEEIRDVVSYRGNDPISSRLVSRGTKTNVPVLKTAEECGLPIPRAANGGRMVRGIRSTTSFTAGKQAPVDSRGVLQCP